MHLLRGILLVLLFPLFFIGGYYTSERTMQKKIQSSISQGKECKTQLQQALGLAKKEIKQDVCLSVQKEKALEKVEETQVYFSSKVVRKSPTVVDVEISLMGGNSMRIDASDLVLNYSENLKITEMIPGPALPSYPRKLSEGGVITLTGIASLNGNGIIFGQPNNIFVTLHVEKTGELKQKGVITLNKTDTNAFLQGNPILDISKTFETIEL